MVRPGGIELSGKFPEALLDGHLLLLCRGERADPSGQVSGLARGAERLDGLLHLNLRERFEVGKDGIQSGLLSERTLAHLGLQRSEGQNGVFRALSQAFLL